jgi:hypothetical protein
MSRAAQKLVRQRMNSKRLLNTAYTSISVLVSASLFIIGGSFIWGGGAVQAYGILLMIYSIASCISLLRIWTKPNRTLVLFETAFIALLLILAWYFFLGLEVFESKWVFASGATIAFAVKWLAITQVSKMKFQA